MSEGNAATARMNVARIIREMAEVTEPPGLQRAVL
jgi:hypothetical protein